MNYFSGREARGAKEAGLDYFGSPYYDPASFAPVTGARFGNMGLCNLRGPGFFNMNSGLFYSFNITEKLNVQFRAEGLNVTNTPQLQNPNVTVTAPSNFMRITAANQTRRTFRFGLRIAF